MIAIANGMTKEQFIDAINANFLGKGTLLTYSNTSQECIDIINDNFDIFADFFLTTFIHVDYGDGRTFKNLLNYNFNKIQELIDTSETLVFDVFKTGDGSKVSTLSFESFITCTMTMTGDGYFYDNIEATEGQSKTKIITQGSLRTFYVKVSGDAQFTVPNLIDKWGRADQQFVDPKAGWYTRYPDIENPNTDYPCIDVDISTLYRISSLNLYGGNIIHGNISALTRLTYIESGNSQNELGHINITGSLSNNSNLEVLDSGWSGEDLSAVITNFTKLKVVWCYENHITGDVTGLDDLTYYETWGNDEAEGSFNNKVGLWFLKLHGKTKASVNLATLPEIRFVEIYTNTLTDFDPTSIAELNQIMYYDLTGIVLTSEQINSILAKFVTSKDVSRVPGAIYIDLRGASGSGTATGQGLIDKAYLESYFISRGITILVR